MEQTRMETKEFRQPGEEGGQGAKHTGNVGFFPAPSAAGDLQLRLAELERENLRLQRLVTELLFKNQELRKALCQ
jgi:hypothetical protein